MMTVKLSISLTDSQDAFVRHFVEQGRCSSASAVLQQGLELLRLKAQEEELEAEALRQLLQARKDGAFVSGAAMQDRIADIADRKRRAHGV